MPIKLTLIQTLFLGYPKVDFALGLSVISAT